MKNFLKSFGFAVRGILASVIDQRNMRVLVVMASLVISFAFYFDVGPIEWCILLSCISLVIALEMVNSAIENLVDLVTMEKKPLAGKIKDMAAGAVLFASALSSIIGVIIFGRYVVALLH